MIDIRNIHEVAVALAAGLATVPGLDTPEEIAQFAYRTAYALQLEAITWAKSLPAARAWEALDEALRPARSEPPTDWKA